MQTVRLDGSVRFWSGLAPVWTVLWWLCRFTAVRLELQTDLTLPNYVTAVQAVTRKKVKFSKKKK